MSTFSYQFLEQFEEFFTTHQLLKRGSRVLLAVSGGVDSMTMLRIVKELEVLWNFSISVAHVNHQLRGAESLRDEDFVREAVEKSRTPFYSTRVDTLEYAQKHGMGKQEAARDLRYRFFEEVRASIGADAVATAHTADDNAETVLMNALRGCGIRGLTGIPVRRPEGNVIRPLLFAYRKEVERYAQEAGIRYCSDSSNESLAYKRNFIRLQLMPLLRTKFETDIAQSLNRISSVMRELEGRLTTDTGAAYDRVVFTDGPRTFVNIPLLLKQTPLVQDEIILTLFRAQDIEPLAEKVAHVLNLCLMQTGRSLSLSGRVKVSRDRDRLVFLSSVPDESFAYAVEVGKSYRFPGFEFTAQVERSVPEEFNRDRMTEFVDAAQLGNSLVVRNWKEGDWFIPLGLGTKRKLSDFFVDNKIPRFEKNRIPLLESDGRVVWVCGHRIDDRFKITAKTAAVVKIQYVQHPNG